MTDKDMATEEGEERQISLLEVVQVIVKRKLFIIKVCAVAAAASACYTLTLPSIYSATAKVLPPQKEAGGGLSTLLSQAGGLAGLAGGSLTGGSDLYLGILKSRSVQDAVIKRLDLMKVYGSPTIEDARVTLEQTVKMQGGKDGIISIVADDKDPKRAALLANTFVDELARTTIRLNLTKAGTERVFLEKRLALVKNDLKAAEEDLKSFSQRNKIVQVDSQAKASIEGIAHMKAELASKEVQLAVLRNNRTDESPEVQAMLSAIRRLRGEIGAQAASGGGGEGIPSVGQVPGVGLEYTRKMRELKTQEAIFEQLTKQYEMAKLSEAKDSSSLQVLDEAVAPLNRSKPHRTKIVMLSEVFAFFLSIVLALLLEIVAKMPEGEKALVRDIRKQLLSLRSEA